MRESGHRKVKKAAAVAWEAAGKFIVPTAGILTRHRANY